MKHTHSKKPLWPWIIGIIIVALILIVLGSGSNTKKEIKKENKISSETEKTAVSASRKVATMCTKDMFTKFHIHPNLSIIINGEEQEIPANIGIKPSCMTSIHTHDAGGEIHVEAPRKEDFVLSDFFAVWGKEFNNNQILDAVVDENSEIVMTVNGEKVDTYENTLLVDKDMIVIEYKKR